MGGDLQTWWRWIEAWAPNKTISWLLAIGLASGSVWWIWPEIEQKPFVKNILAVLTPEPALCANMTETSFPVLNPVLKGWFAHFKQAHEWTLQLHKFCCVVAEKGVD